MIRERRRVNVGRQFERRDARPNNLSSDNEDRWLHLPAPASRRRASQEVASVLLQQSYSRTPVLSNERQEIERIDGTETWRGIRQACLRRVGLQGVVCPFHVQRGV